MPKPRVLDESSVQAVRERFNQEQKYRNKTIDFDQILELFGNVCISFSEIAKSVNLSREQVRRLYKKYFASLFPNRPCGRARQKICTLKTNLQRVEDFSNAPAALRKIAEIARAHGYSARKIPTEKRGNRIAKFSTTSMLINRNICTIHSIKNICSPSPRNKSTYTHLRLRRTQAEKHDFVVVIRQISAGAIEQVFLIPTKTLLENWGCGYFYIREQEISAYPNSHPRIDFWQYLDAWRLLAAAD